MIEAHIVRVGRWMREISLHTEWTETNPPWVRWSAAGAERKARRELKRRRKQSEQPDRIVVIRS